MVLVILMVDDKNHCSLPILWIHCIPTNCDNSVARICPLQFPSTSFCFFAFLGIFVVWLLSGDVSRKIILRRITTQSASPDRYCVCPTCLSGSSVSYSSDQDCDLPLLYKHCHLTPIDIIFAYVDCVYHTHFFKHRQVTRVDVFAS